MEAYRKRYGENVENISDILEEMTAGAFQKIAADEGSLRELLQEMERENKGILAQIKEFLNKLLESLQGLLKDNRFSSFAEKLHKDVENPKKLKKIFAEKLKRAGEMQREDEEQVESQRSTTKISKKLGGYFPDIHVSTEDISVFEIQDIKNIWECKGI